MSLDSQMPSGTTAGTTARSLASAGTAFADAKNELLLPKKNKLPWNMTVIDASNSLVVFLFSML
jgi:hypothetical protein